MEKFIRIILAVMLLLCLAKMPYGYYQLVRFLAMVGFGGLAFLSNKEGKNGEMIAFIILALLFDPFEKIALGRTLWNVIDVVVAGYLLLGLRKSN